ncbi:MAG: cation transporter [Afipia sp.]|nr:cation transporter [Afipia sp.]
MAQAFKTTPTEGEALRFRVEGADCPSCAGKIETVLGRVPGLSEVKVTTPRPDAEG